MSMFPEGSGIYQIRNTANGKAYVGSAVKLKRRWFHHRKLLRAGQHHSKHLQRAWLVSGEAAFVFEVIEECDASILIDREQFHIDRMRCTDDAFGYNMNPTAYSQLGRRHTDDAKRRISDAMKRRVFTDAHRRALSLVKQTSEKAKRQSDDAIARASLACVGRIESEETRRKKSESHRGKPLSPEHRAAISKGLKRAGL